MFILNEMHMFANLHVCESLNIFVIVFVQVYVCVSGFLFACAYGKVVATIKCCPPALRFGLAFPSPLRPVRLRLSCAGSTAPVACAACQTVIFDRGTHNAVTALLHAAPGA